MDKQLEIIAKSYDKGVEYGRKGINLYDDLTSYITDHPDYPKFVKLMQNGSDSKGKEVKEYLAPEVDMRFIDLGCCLNLMFNDYDKWNSTYHGVDISNETIQLLKEIVVKRDLRIGSLYCGSVHDTPYEDNYFDIAACIGILEYFEEDFIREAMVEAHRIIKPKGRFVLDIPNLESPVFGISNLVEEYLGRPDRFDMTRNEFQVLIGDYFEVIKTEKVAGMIQYFLVNKG
jgi:ubiquinone/menaquinone biosynthesis C-methylase UbiE